MVRVSSFSSQLSVVGFQWSVVNEALNECYPWNALRQLTNHN